MRTYRLSSRCEENRLTPRDVLGRFIDTFGCVESDIDDPKPIGLGVIEAYERTSMEYPSMKRQFCSLPDNPPSLQTLGAIWRGAVCMDVWTDRDANQGFNAIVNNEPAFDIVFSGNVSTAKRREIARRAAEALGYDLRIEDRFNEFDAEFFNSSADPPRRAWWQVWQRCVIDEPWVEPERE